MQEEQRTQREAERDGVIAEMRAQLSRYEEEDNEQVEVAEVIPDVPVTPPVAAPPKKERNLLHRMFLGR
jgi:hypothetical protein